MTLTVEREVSKMEMLANSPQGLIKFSKDDEYEEHVKECFDHLERMRMAYTMRGSELQKLGSR